MQRGQQIELTGEITRIDDDSAMIALGPLVTVAIDKERLVESTGRRHASRFAT